MNNKSVRLQLIQYLQEYFLIKNKKIVKRGRKVKTEVDVIGDLHSFCNLAKKEVSNLRSDLKDKISLLQKKNDPATMKEILEELEVYSNANEEAVLMRIMKIFEEFEKEKDKVKRKELLIGVEDFVYGVMSNENLEVSWDLFAFLKECFFIYYNHSQKKAEMEYGVNPKDDKQIEDSVGEKLSFLREVTAG